jgi:beta-lactamase superfamily II metal-dependent hydrolase
VITRILDEDLTRIRGSRFNQWEMKEEHNKVVKILYWGDAVELHDIADNDDTTKGDVRVRYYDYSTGKHRDGTIRKRRKSGAFVPLAFRTTPLMEVTFVDVQQGDATFVRMPSGQYMVIDGGEGPFVARLLASENPGTTQADPLIIDALVITHGDADHFVGLKRLADAATDKRKRKRIHTKVLRHFHNGLVKAPSGSPIGEMFGESKKIGSTRYVTGLLDDPRDATNPNGPFTEWNEALSSLTFGVAPTGDDPSLPEIRRIAKGDDDAFDAFRPDIDVQVLGPITDQIDGGDALAYLRNQGGSVSASHTINGHSVVLRMVYKNVSFLLGGDLNVDSERRLRLAVEADPSRTLRSEVLKVPHHGSHDFEQAFLDAVNPVVSVVSSGDDNAAKEYVHPRAVLMAALGRASRPPMPLVFSTELAAFFAYRGFILTERHRGPNHDSVTKANRKPHFFAHQRLVFGAVRVRTDGVRVLCATESANARIKEAYAFVVDSGGNVTPSEWSLV